MTALLLAAALVVITFVAGPLVIGWASRRADRNDSVPADIVDDNLPAFHERRAS